MFKVRLPPALATPIGGLTLMESTPPPNQPPTPLRFPFAAAWAGPSFVVARRFEGFSCHQRRGKRGNGPTGRMEIACRWSRWWAWSAALFWPLSEFPILNYTGKCSPKTWAPKIRNQRIKLKLHKSLGWFKVPKSRQQNISNSEKPNVLLKIWAPKIKQQVTILKTILKCFLRQLEVPHKSGWYKVPKSMQQYIWNLEKPMISFGKRLFFIHCILLDSP